MCNTCICIGNVSICTYRYTLWLLIKQIFVYWQYGPSWFWTKIKNSFRFKYTMWLIQLLAGVQIWTAHQLPESGFGIKWQCCPAIWQTQTNTIKHKTPNANTNRNTNYDWVQNENTVNKSSSRLANSFSSSKKEKLLNNFPSETWAITLKHCVKTRDETSERMLDGGEKTERHKKVPHQRRCPESIWPLTFMKLESQNYHKSKSLEYQFREASL